MVVVVIGVDRVELIVVGWCYYFVDVGVVVVGNNVVVVSNVVV